MLFSRERVRGEGRAVGTGGIFEVEKETTSDTTPLHTRIKRTDVIV